MQKIHFLTDYKGYFGSKQRTKGYKTGMDQDAIAYYLKQKGYEVVFLNFSEIDFSKQSYKDEVVLYTSSEDPGYHYKDYIEDVIYGLELQGAILIPGYKFLRSNNNKVFMEMLRQIEGDGEVNRLKAKHYGTLEELEEHNRAIQFPFVFKTAAGALSRGVALVKNKSDLKRTAQKFMRSVALWDELWNWKNYFKHGKKVKRNSLYRKKFVAQEFVEGLDNDWKVLIYDTKYYLLNRRIRENDFRASGSGKFDYVKEIPEGLLDYAKLVYEQLNVPHLSIDLAYNGSHFYLLEYQAVYFGTKTLENSPFYFEQEEKGWKMIESTSNLEEVFIHSLCNYLEREKSSLRKN